MKIGIDCRSIEQNITGVGRYLINLLNYWQIEKDIDFFLYFKNKIPVFDFLSSKNFYKKCLKVKSNALFTHFFFPLAAKKDKIDVLFSPGYILPIFWRGKSAVAMHDIYYEAHPQKFSWPSFWDKILLKWVSKKSAEKANIIFTPSEFSKREIIKYYKVSEQKVIVIHLGVSNDWFDKPDENFNLASYELKKNKYLIYFASIFNRRHLVETISAFKMVAKKLPELKFLIIGKNYTNPFIDIENFIEKINKELGQKTIIYFDYVEKKPLTCLVKNAYASIYLSDYEGFGLPVIEAAASGVPVITTTNGSLKEVMNDAAIYVKDPSDIKEIAGWIYLLFTDKELHQFLKEKGIDRARLFKWKDCAEKTLEILKKI